MFRFIRKYWWLFPTGLVFHVFSFRDSPPYELVVSGAVLMIGILVVLVFAYLISRLWAKK
jgi:hypothetical protein